MAAGVVDRRVEAARQLGVKRLADELITSLERELDYGAEAASGAAFLEHLEDEEGIAAPLVVPGAVDPPVLVMEEIDGVTVADHDAVEASPVPADVLADAPARSRSSTRCCATGIYHADPHPGNIFVDPQRHALVPRLRRGRPPRARSSSRPCRRWRSASSSRTPSCWPGPCVRLAGGDEAGDSRALEADIGLVLSEGLGAGSFDPKAMSLMLDMMSRHGLEVPRR